MSARYIARPLFIVALLYGCATSTPTPEKPIPSSPAPEETVRSTERGTLVAVEEDDPAFQQGEALEAAAGRYSDGVSALIESRQEEISNCFLRELKKNPQLAGELNVALSVQPGGSLSARPTFTTNTLNNNKVEACLVELLLSLSYPEPYNQEYADVTYRFRIGVF